MEKIWIMFISRRRNETGRRYGFVYFKHIKDSMQLEGELDSIRIGEQKLYVNLPRFTCNNFNEVEKKGKEIELGTKKKKGKEIDLGTKKKKGKGKHDIGVYS